jgi:EAL domain-containing protein (putative c-di-GMP-specific phosphodiesterase class I)/ActR/RegA family two-component response regulator
VDGSGTLRQVSESLSKPDGSAAQTGSRPTARVLLVDDDPEVLKALARRLRAVGFEVSAHSSAASALGALRNGGFDVAISDITMPEMDGLGFIRTVRHHDLDLPVVLITGAPAFETAIRAVEYGAFRYLVKPLSDAELYSTLEHAVNLYRTARASREFVAESEQGSALAGRRRLLQANFERALASVWIAYQPIVTAGDSCVFAQEALLRSNDPTLPDPTALLDAAERTGRLCDLGQLVRSSAAAQIRRAPSDWSFFINVHPHEINAIDLLLDGPMRDLSTRIVLEITERASLDQIPNAYAAIAQLRKSGYRIAIDDLGAGYSGLSSFAELEPEFVKFDMSLVREIDKRATKQRLVAAITAMCKGLGTRVVAEGVETEAERVTLIELGCELLQGHLFAHPGPAFPEPNRYHGGAT